MKKTFVKVLSLVCLLALCGSILSIGYAVEKCPYYEHYNMANLEEYNPPDYEEQYANLDDQYAWIDGDGREGEGHIYRKIHHYRCKICKCDVPKTEVFYSSCPHAWGGRSYSKSFPEMDWQYCPCGASRTIKHNCSYYRQEDAGRSYSRCEQGDSNGHWKIYKLKKKCTACQKTRVTSEEQREKVPHNIKTTRNQVTPRITYITDTCTVCGYKRTRTVYN